MRQQTLAGNGFERFCKRTRRETFLLEMDEVIPWRDLCKVIKPFYPKREGAGRLTAGDKGKNRTKSRVRANVEHPFLVPKQIFGFTKVR